MIESVLIVCVFREIQAEPRLSSLKSAVDITVTERKFPPFVCIKIRLGKLRIIQSCVGLSEEEILQGCQKKGGLLGISGVSNDLRYVIEAADASNARAKLAVDVFVTGIVHYIGSFFMDLGGLTDLVFTAGIGEHSDCVRAMVCEKLGAIGVKLDEEANKKNAPVISSPNSAVTVRVIPTDEELGIARRTYELV